MRQVIFGVALAAILVAPAMSDQIIWRSSTTGVLPPPAPSEPSDPVQALAASYAGQRVAWPRNGLVTVTPTITGGSGQVVWFWPAAATLPPGLIFNSATGVFSGRTAAIGDYHWSVVVRDQVTKEAVGATVRIFIEP